MQQHYVKFSEYYWKLSLDCAIRLSVAAREDRWAPISNRFSAHAWFLVHNFPFFSRSHCFGHFVRHSLAQRVSQCVVVQYYYTAMCSAYKIAALSSWSKNNNVTPCKKSDTAIRDIRTSSFSVRTSSPTGEYQSTWYIRSLGRKA